jgi:hypothetical protein
MIRSGVRFTFARGNMPTQPSERLTIDFWTLIPEIFKRVVGRQASGQFVVRDGTIQLVRRKLTSAGTYYAQFYLPSNERDLATGFFGLCRGMGAAQADLAGWAPERVWRISVAGGMPCDTEAGADVIFRSGHAAFRVVPSGWKTAANQRATGEGHPSRDRKTHRKIWVRWSTASGSCRSPGVGRVL